MPQKQSNLKFLLGITVAVVLPLSFYAIARGLGKDKITMPTYYIGDQKLPAKEAGAAIKKGSLKEVGDLSAVNQFGDKVSLKNDLKGRAMVVDFFFTTCPTICPKLTQNMRLLQNAYKRSAMMRNDTMMQLISITVDPERDTFQALRAYADRYSADGNRWWFLTGNKKALYDWARTELHLAVPEGNGGADDFIHTEQVVLLDGDRYIRGYYNGLDTLEMSRCANDIGMLMMEKKHY